MAYNIVKVTRSNYHHFDDMIFWRMHNKERTEEQKLLSKGEENSRVLDELDNPNLYIYAVVIERKMVGWISLIYLPKVGKFGGQGHVYVDELWIQPLYRRKGLAKELMKKADEMAKALDVTGIRLYVNATNQEAKDLYERCGYSCSCSAFLMEK